MSIIVKGVEMPTGCEPCPYRKDLGVCRASKPFLLRKYAYESNKRHPDCPISGLPDKHGPLIDADEKLSFYDSDNWESPINLRSAMAQLSRYAVGKLPVIIIEAEE